MKKNVSLSSSVKYVSLVTYLSNEQLEEAILKRKEYITGFAYINHEPDGDEKVSHTHVQINSTRSRRMSDYLGWLKGYMDDEGKPINSRIEETLSISSVHDYFLHARPEDVGKHQYTEEDIRLLNGISDPWSERTKFDLAEETKEQLIAKKEAQADDCEQLIQDIIDEVPARQMARRYGRDYMKNFGKYNQFAAMVILEESQDIEKARRIAGYEQGFLNNVANDAYVSGITCAYNNIKQMAKDLQDNNCFNYETIMEQLDK